MAAGTVLELLLGEEDKRGRVEGARAPFRGRRPLRAGSEGCAGEHARSTMAGGQLA